MDELNLREAKSYNSRKGEGMRKHIIRIVLSVVAYGFISGILGAGIKLLVPEAFGGNAGLATAIIFYIVFFTTDSLHIRG